MSKFDLTQKGGKGSDNFQTPPWPVISLLNVIGSQLTDSVIWDPCMGEGLLIETLNDNSLTALGTDEITGTNFLIDESPYEFDAIITNPPYSKKDQFIQRCYELGKPFALLMPLTALEGKKRLPMYKENGMQLCLLPKRVNFKTPSGKGSGAWFATAWFTHGFNLPNDINYLEEY